MFNYSRCRFACDESYEMPQRYVHFDVKELARIAADAVRAKSFVIVEKYPDACTTRLRFLPWIMEL